MKSSIVIGGTRCIGSVITKILRNRGDKTITASRRKNDESDHISFFISNQLRKSKKWFNRLPLEMKR